MTQNNAKTVRGSVKGGRPVQGFDIGQELQAFSDHVVPNLDVYEQAIFIYLLRHSYLEGSDSLVGTSIFERFRSSVAVSVA